MANPIRRLVQLILDKAAADKVEKDARAALGGVEKSLTSLGSVARRIGALLAAAFGVRALIAFGKAAVKEALESERAWSDLAGTIRATGDSFEAVEGNLVALGKAFQAATTHTDEDYAQSLSRLITITGDVAASTNNMGLVANVAAQFFSGDLAPAVELVSKVMNGNVIMLQRMGIHVKSAQEGLDLLANRSFGAAERQAGTFGGRLEQLNNLWHDFKEELGGVLINSDSAGGALDVLRGIVETLTSAVKSNKTELQTGLTSALKGLVEVFDGVYRGVRGVVEILGGAFFLALGTVLSPLVLLNKGLALLAEGASHVTRWFGMQGATQSLKDFAKSVDALAETLRTPTTVGLSMLGEGVSRFGSRTQLAEDVLAGIGNAGVRRPGPKLAVSPPQVSKNITTPITEAQLAFDMAMKSIHANSTLMGRDFDALGAEASALTTVMEAFGKEGIEPTDERMQRFAARFREVKLEQAWKEFNDSLLQIHDTARVLGPDFDALGAEASALTTLLQRLQLRGKDADAGAIRGIKTRLDEIKIGQVVKDFDQATVAANQMWDAIGQQGTSIAEVFGNRIAQMSDEAERLRAAMEAIPVAMRASSPEFAAYANRYNQIQEAIRQTTDAQKLYGEVATDVAGAVGAALEGSLGKYAAGKAKQNLLEAAELAVEAAASVIFSLGIATGPILALAARHLAIAAAWGALAGASGGFSGGGGGGGGGSIGAARGASATASRTAQPVPQDVTIVLTGPGFHALNPEVQRVVYGAEQLARQRFGQNARIHLRGGG